MIVSGYETIIDAAQLVAGLVAISNGEVVERFLKVVLVKPGEQPLTVNVFIDKTSMSKTEDLPDKTELITCLTTEGHKVTFLAPPPNQRVVGMKATAYVDMRLTTT